MGKNEIEGVKAGLKYAFSIAALFEGLEMLQAMSFHLQSLHEWEVGMILGVGVGISAYIYDNYDKVTIPSSQERRRDIEQSGGKVVELPWSPKPPRPHFD